MSTNNRFVPPKAEVELADEPVSEEFLAQANKLVKTARLSFVVLFGGFLVQLFVFPKRHDLSFIFILLYLVSFVAAHIYLGRAAATARRSWVLYGLAPVLVPVLGGLISFGFLRSFIPEPSDA